MKLVILLIAIVLLFLLPSSVLAESSYVLPYPSEMPGSKFYQLQLLKDIFFKYWYFGNFGQFTYNLKQSDKYLVEAKTLFEYRQYLLGYRALKKSDEYFLEAEPYLTKAQEERKNISKNILVFKSAALKHKEILEKLGSQAPEKFVWKSEKSLPSTLDIKNSLRRSILIRNSSL